MIVRHPSLTITRTVPDADAADWLAAGWTTDGPHDDAPVPDPFAQYAGEIPEGADTTNLFGLAD